MRLKTHMRRGFSFAEILFAVMILGIGFIMVAAMFPVAIKQTELTSQENAAANMGLAGVSSLEQLATSALLPTALSPTLQSTLSTTLLPPLIHSPVWTFHDPRLAPPLYSATPTRDQIWQTVCGNLILRSDSRYAWVPMYRRDLILDTTQTPPVYVASSMVQLILIGVQTRNQPAYSAARDLTPLPLGNPNAEATLEGKVVQGIVVRSPANGTPPIITFQTEGARIGEGAFVVVSDDGLPYDQYSPPGQFNGRILRVGAYRADLTLKFSNSPTYELVPGYDLPAGANFGLAGPTAWGIVIGRGLADPNSPGSGVAGVVQDISVYTTYIHVH